MFRIDAPIDEGRSEPLLEPGPGSAVRLRLSPVPAPLAIDLGAEGRREPSMPLGWPAAPGTALPPQPGRPVISERRRRPFGPIGSLIVHLLPLLLLLAWPMHKPVEVVPIPVRLVFQPPPPPPPPRPLPKPAPKPRLRPETRPPPGRIASVNMGDTRTKGRDRAKSEKPATSKEPAAKQEAALEAPQQTAFLPPPPVLPAPPALVLPKPPQPRVPRMSRPRQKMALGEWRPLRRMPQRASLDPLQRAHLDPQAAQFPGPAATRDEYLAYLAYLAHQHIGLLSRAFVGDRRGETIINVLVLDDGTVAMLSVGLSSGYPDIDVRVEDMIRAVGRFPPLPQWFQGSGMHLEFRLEFPEALDG